MSPLLTRAEAMEILNVKRWTFDQIVASGALKPVRLRPRCIRYRAEDLRSFIEGPKVRPSEAEHFATSLMKQKRSADRLVGDQAAFFVRRVAFFATSALGNIVSIAAATDVAERPSMWPYRPRVIASEACPAMCCTTFASAPAPMAKEMAVCRKSWKRSSGRPIDVIAGAQTFFRHRFPFDNNPGQTTSPRNDARWPSSAI